MLSSKALLRQIKIFSSANVLQTIRRPPGSAPDKWVMLKHLSTNDAGSITLIQRAFPISPIIFIRLFTVFLGQLPAWSFPSSFIFIIEYAGRNGYFENI
jgi:hypothetical protein